MASPTKSPPAPPKLPSKQEAASVIAQAQTQNGEGERGALDEIRADLHDASASLASALDRLDEIEPEQG